MRQTFDDNGPYTTTEPETRRMAKLASPLNWKNYVHFNPFLNTRF